MSSFRKHPPAPAPNRPFRFPEAERITLSNGVRVILARSSSPAPVVSVRAIARAGADRDPAGLAGLASMTAEMIDEGTKTRSAIDIASGIADLGAALGTGCDWDCAYVSLDILSKNLVRGLEIFADVACNPAFDDKELERVRNERLTDILQNRDEPAVIAAETFARIVQAGTPYAMPMIGTDESVRVIRRDEIAACHKSTITPKHLSIVLTGAFNPANTRAVLESLFGALPEASVNGGASFAAAPIDSTTVTLVDRPQAVQSEIRVGHPGVARNTPDFFPIGVMNGILGGVFTSRLNMNLREKNGFTYHVRSGFSFRRQPGSFAVSTAVRNEVSADAIREILRELERIGSGDVTRQELDETKNYLMDSFPATVQSAASLAARFEEMELHGLPTDYFDLYRERIAAVTEDDVTRVAKTYIHPSRCAIVVVGKAEEIRAQLDGLGYPMQIR